MNIIELSKTMASCQRTVKTLISQMEMSLSRCQQNGRGAY